MTHTKIKTTIAVPRELLELCVGILKLADEEHAPVIAQLEHLLGHKRCVICDEPFTAARSDANACYRPECRKKWKLALAAPAVERWRAENKEKFRAYQREYHRKWLARRKLKSTE